MRWFVRLSLVALSFLAGVIAFSPPASAHPLGNFTVNQYAGLRVQRDAVVVDYVLDMAELPAYQARSQEIGDRPPADWASSSCASVASASTLSIMEATAPLIVEKSSVTFPPGQAGLDTLRLECTLRAAAAINGDTRITYRSTAYADRIGWREVTAVGDGVHIVSSDAPATSSSARLTSYPSDSLSSPLDVRAATLVAAPGGPAAAAVAAATTSTRGLDRATAAFARFAGRHELTLGLGLAALGLALVLGAAHAFAPGHGKTVLAAYLVAERGRLRHALTVAATVTATHTAGVLVLGIVLTTSLRFAPERLYGWLGVISGLLLAGVGAAMLRRTRWLSALGAHHHHHHGPGHHHDHDHHDHDHDHHDHDHDHPDGHHDHGGGNHDHGRGRRHRQRGPLRLPSLIAMGFAGGLAPSPSAVVVLLGAVALGRTWFGVLLVLGYGAGMAAALTAIGFVLARWRAVFERRASGRVGGLLRRTVPVATAALVVLVGLGLAARSIFSVTG